SGGHAGEPGLPLPHRHLVAPVEPLLIRRARAVESDLAADVSHPRLAEPRHQAPQRVRAPEAVRVGEREDLAARLLDGHVERGDLAAAREVQHLIRARGPGDLHRAVGRPVRRDHDLQPLARVVLRERVANLAVDHVLLVVRGDDQRDPRQGPPARGLGPGTARSRERPEDQWVAEVGVGEQSHRDPEDDGDDRPAPSSEYSAIVWAATRSHEYGPAAAAAAAAASRSRSPGSASSADRRSASASGSPGGTSAPAPVSATSAKPPTSLITIGLPNASAAYRTPDCSASRCGSTTRSARRK